MLERMPRLLKMLRLLLRVHVRSRSRRVAVDVGLVDRPPLDCGFKHIESLPKIEGGVSYRLSKLRVR